MDYYNERLSLFLGRKAQAGTTLLLGTDEFPRPGGGRRVVPESQPVAVALVADQCGRVGAFDPRNPGGVLVRRERAGEFHPFVICGHDSSIGLQVG